MWSATRVSPTTLSRRTNRRDCQKLVLGCPHLLHCDLDEVVIEVELVTQRFEGPKALADIVLVLLDILRERLDLFNAYRWPLLHASSLVERTCRTL